MGLLVALILLGRLEPMLLQGSVQALINYLTLFIIGRINRKAEIFLVGSRNLFLPRSQASRPALPLLLVSRRVKFPFHILHGIICSISKSGKILITLFFFSCFGIAFKCSRGPTWHKEGVILAAKLGRHCTGVDVAHGKVVANLDRRDHSQFMSMVDGWLRCFRWSPVCSLSLIRGVVGGNSFLAPLTDFVP